MASYPHQGNHKISKLASFLRAILISSQRRPKLVRSCRSKVNLITPKVITRWALMKNNQTIRMRSREIWRVWEDPRPRMLLISRFKTFKLLITRMVKRLKKKLKILVVVVVEKCQALQRISNLLESPNQWSRQELPSSCLPSRKWSTESVRQSKMVWDVLRSLRRTKSNWSRDNRRSRGGYWKWWIVKMANL